MSFRMLEAQNLHVYYDLFTDSVSYRKGDQLIHNPKIRKGDQVALHFTEYNPYLYRADVAIEQRNDERFSGGYSLGAFQSLIPGLSSIFPAPGLRDSTATAPGLLSFFNLPLLKIGEKSIQLKDLFANSRGPDQLLDQARVQLQELAQIQADMSEVCQGLQRMEKSNQAGQLALQNFDRLLFNPQIKPSMIKKLVLEYEALVFPGKTADELQLDDAFRWQDRPAIRQGMLQTLQSRQQAFDHKMAQMAPITSQLSDLDLGSPQLEQFAADLREVAERSGSLKQQIDDYTDQQAKKQARELTMEQIMDLQLKFRELSAQNFSYDCLVQAEKDLVIVNASFLSRDTLANGSLQMAPHPPKTKTIKIETSGGLHINTSFGIGFGRFFNAAQSFSVRDDQIVADDNDIVQPALSTLLHFYGNHPRGTTVAGTFGIGIPLGGSNISAINFYLGPSLLFGRGQRIVLSGGLMTGPVKRLARGLKPGDGFNLNGGDIPLQSRYELGYFLGVSFNMGN